MSAADQETGEGGVATWEVRFASLSDTGTRRGHNEDACGTCVESPTHVLAAVADGVGGEEGGEVASGMAIDVTLRTYKLSPAAWGPLKRLYRAAQQANIEIHDRALVVTELRRMATTLTAVVVEGGVAHAAHVGDSRLYLLRDGTLTQKTKDHVASGEQGVLTRSLGRELIAAVDRLSFPVVAGDTIVLCSDGLYNVLGDEEVRQALGSDDPAESCNVLVTTANARGTPDNLTAVVMKISGQPPIKEPAGLRGMFARWMGR
jgi:serine/threonine protein phosphatase PrpC